MIWSCYFKATEQSDSDAATNKATNQFQKKKDVNSDAEMYCGFFFVDPIGPELLTKLRFAPTTKSDPVDICAKVLGSHRVPKKVGHESVIMVTKDEFVPMMTAIDGLFKYYLYRYSNFEFIF